MQKELLRQLHCQRLRENSRRTEHLGWWGGLLILILVLRGEETGYQPQLPNPHWLHPLGQAGINLNFNGDNRNSSTYNLSEVGVWISKRRFGHKEIARLV